MYKRTLNAIAAIILVLTIFTPTRVDAAILQSKRLSGIDRYETNCKIVSEGWTSSDYAIIASGEGFADALCAAPLAKKYNAPILLTGKDVLDLNIKNQLERLNVKKIFIIGGPAVVSDNIKSQIEDMKIDVTRIYGQDRFQTSVEVAKKLDNPNRVVITNGYGFADALSIAPIAAERGMPILLTDKEDLPSPVKDFLAGKSNDSRYVIGGSGVVSDNVTSQLGHIVRLGGQSRYATNAAVLNYFSGEFSYDKVYVASGKNYPDALSGSVLSALSSSPLILVDDNIDASVTNSIKPQYDKFKTIITLGGTGVIPETLVNSIVNGKFIGTTSKASIIKIGSTKDDVLSVMGKPDYELDFNGSWAMTYGGTGTVYLYDKGDGLKVIGWSNPEGNLKVSIGEKISSAAPITLGSSMDDVIKACGTPEWNDPFFNILHDNSPTWNYIDGSYIAFDSNYKVIGWNNSGNLKVNLGSLDPSAPNVTIGSSTEDVITALGTPIRLHPSTGGPLSFSYRDCYIQFSADGKVSEWHNFGNPKINIGDKDPSAPAFRVGSSKDDVIKAMGTPTTMQGNDIWFYDASEIIFNNGKVFIVQNRGNLKYTE